MKYLKLNTVIFTFVFLIGTLFLVQCDRDTNRDDMGIKQDETAPDQTESTYRPSETPGGEMRFEQDREDLASDLEELRDSMNVMLENRRSAAGDESGELDELENDLNELDQTITNLRNATEENWEQTRRETQQVYERIRNKYMEAGTDPNTPSNDPGNS